MRVPLDSSYLFERTSQGKYLGPPGQPAPVGGSPEVELFPYDNVLIFRQPDWELQRTVSITGAVLYPGKYSLQTRADRLTHLERIPARSEVVEEWPAWADPTVVAAYSSRGVTLPWRHQVRAAEHAHAGEHVVLATGTASGKSLAYQLPALTAIEAGRGPRGQRGATVLYVAPTKALAQDQLASLVGLGVDLANPTVPVTLYRSVGLSEVRWTDMYERTVPATGV